MLSSETKRRIDSCRDILAGKLPLLSKPEQERIVAELDVEAVCGLIAVFEAKIRCTAPVWGKDA